MKKPVKIKGNYPRESQARKLKVFTININTIQSSGSKLKY